VDHVLVVRPEAESDIDAAYVWYEDQRTGLGAEFLEEVEKCFNLLQENPRIYALIYSDVRRALLRRFPFGAFYVLESDTISVLAVLHTARHPDSWERRIDV